MDTNGEVGDVEEFEFHLETVDETSSDDESSDDDTSSDDDISSSEQDPSSKEDGNASCDKKKFRTMSHAVERHTTLDEYWEIVNKTFETEEEAYNFYNKYARDKGFSVRRQRVRRSKQSGALLFRRFLCSREGEREAKWIDKKPHSRRPRALTRIGCPARLDVRLDRSRGTWYVNNFVDEHNHRLATRDEVPFLRSHRKMKDFQKTEIMAMEGAGIRKHVIMNVLQCRYGGYGEVGIIRKDAYNFSSRYKRSRIAEGDAMTVLGLMQSRQKEQPDFYYDYQLDGDGHLKTMFWCDGQSRMDYQSFGDVIVFDSTYRMNRYKMPFVPFVGLNHHRKTTVFGCGIVSDERVESYVWMLRALMKAMCQQKPQSIITDGDYSMMKAIRQVLPGVNHRICSWHVEENLPKHLRKKAVQAFRPLIYYGSSPATFEKRWKAFVAEHQTVRNSYWLRMMHNNKKLWATSFHFENFFLGMKSNQRSESLNSSLHKHLDRKISLLDLVEHYKNCVSRLRETEAGCDCEASQSLPVPLTDHREIEVACSHVLTAANFYILQQLIAKIDDFQIFEILVGTDSRRFIIARKNKIKSLYLVDYMCANSEAKLKCTCRKMDREGLPCCHILHVLDHMKFSELPKCCILRRHSKAAKGGLPSRRVSNIYGWSAKRSRYNSLTVLGAEAFDVASNENEEFGKVKDYLGATVSKKFRPDYGAAGWQMLDNQKHQFTKGSVLDPLVVVNKGAPRKNGKGSTMHNEDGNRIKSFHETRQTKCSTCRRVGHNKRKCPWSDPC